MSENFVYYKLQIRLASEQLGTCTQASIFDEHILKKSQKMIADANRKKDKLTKALTKYAGVEITELKEIKELQGIIRRYQEVIGKIEEIPDDLEPLLEYAANLDAEYNEIIKKENEGKSTCFMRSKEGKPMISSHMIIGNIKENLKIIINNSSEKKENKIVKSKVAVGEILALDIKPIEEFMYPDMDIVRERKTGHRKEDFELVIRSIDEMDEKLPPHILERPIKFERMGKVETAISRSEYLPKGTQFTVNLRVRKDSPLSENDAAPLRKILDFGKSNGLGQWRGSGSKGQYFYKLDKLDKDPTLIPDGWN